MTWRFFPRLSLKRSKGEEIPEKEQKDKAQSNQGTVGFGLQQSSSGFRMPLHYPRYKKADYEVMEEWKLDLLLQEYGLTFVGTLDEKRRYAMGAFLWPEHDQL